MSRTTTEVIIVLAAAYPNFEIRKDTLRIYVEMLSDLDTGELERAAKLVMTRSRFFPTIAELREAVADLRTEGMRGGVLSSVDAWNMVNKQILEVGSYGVPQFGDPLTARIVEGMGWRTLCMSENGMADRAHFMKMYGELSSVVMDQERRTPELRSDAARLITGGVTRLVSAYTGEMEVLE